jgi:endonuclease/exonuclease/phosphatase family metal-dependent hydrolase
MAEDAGLRVISWNVHGWVGADGSEDPARIGRVLRSRRPDLAGLQEVVNHYDPASGRHQLQALAEQTGLTAVKGPTIARDESDYGNALLTRLPVLAVRHIDLSFPDREPRAALDVDLETVGGALRVIVTHFGLRPAERRFQVRALIRAIEARSYATLVLMGDLNEWLITGRPARWMNRHFGHGGGPRTFPARFPLFALDRIYVDPAPALRSLCRLASPQVRQASDHLPLEALVQPNGRDGARRIGP